MYFYPCNKYLQVEEIKPVLKKQVDVGDGLKTFIFPEEYNKNKKDGPLKIVKLVSCNRDSQFLGYEGSSVLVPSHLIESIDYDGNTILLVSENIVYGVVVDDLATIQPDKADVEKQTAESLLTAKKISEVSTMLQTLIKQRDAQPHPEDVETTSSEGAMVR